MFDDQLIRHGRAKPIHLYVIFLSLTVAHSLKIAGLILKAELILNISWLIIDH